jgi:putative NADPH-quinone reductase/RimJ/RimL family protein N-acetyltransferase
MTNFSFKSLSTEHLPLLHQWMQESHLQPWWGEGKEWSLNDIYDKYTSYTQGYKLHEEKKKPLFAFIIEVENQPIGYIQLYNAFDFPRKGYDVKDFWQDQSPSLAAVDFYLCENYLGKGWGAEVLKAFLKNHLFSHFDACLVDPDKSNKFAIKSYAKAGFNTLQETASTVIMIARKEKEKNPIIILGSSRGEGNTLKIVHQLINEASIPLVDLRNLNISHYDYNYENMKDDFLPLAEKMVKHNPIVLATPVYWYTMSALMKTFIDRWSDLLDIRKDIGRRLAGKELYVITSYSAGIPRGFEDPFSQTCEYLEIDYKGCFYFYSGDDAELKKNNLLLAERFSHQILDK